jgi:hypothetical protein
LLKNWWTVRSKYLEKVPAENMVGYGERESSTMNHGRLSVWDIVPGIVCKKGIAKVDQFWGIPAHACRRQLVAKQNVVHIKNYDNNKSHHHLR